MQKSFYHRFGKRVFDVSVAVMLLVLLAPLVFLGMFMTRLLLGGPVFFRQERPGLNGKPFRILKLRTMTDARDAQGALLSDEERLTRFGKFLRSTSIDELPALINVIRGEMSLVGPRPLLMRYLDRYTPRQARRHEVRPGLTGLAQVKGRNALSWEERFEWDLRYVETATLTTDLKVLFATLSTVLKRSNIAHEGSATMPEFVGELEEGVVDRAVYVIGAGGHAKVVLSTLRSLEVPVSAIFDDDRGRHGQAMQGVPIAGAVSDIATAPRRRAVIAVGDNHARMAIAQTVDLPWFTVVHPRASVDSTAVLGAGTVIMDGAIVQADARVGAHCIVNTGASIDHDCEIGDYTHVAPGARVAGEVRIGSGALLGIGSTVIPGRRVGDASVVGAGAAVVTDIPAGVTALGVPARVKQTSAAEPGLRPAA